MDVHNIHTQTASVTSLCDPRRDDLFELRENQLTAGAHNGVTIWRVDVINLHKQKALSNALIHWTVKYDDTLAARSIPAITRDVILVLNVVWRRTSFLRRFFFIFFFLLQGCIRVWKVTICYG